MALRLSQKLNYIDGAIDSKNTMGILYRYSGESEKAVQLYQEIIALRTQQGRYDKLTTAYTNLGSVYFEKGDNAQALVFYLKAYDNAEKLNQVSHQMTLLNNMGSAYKSSGLFDLAIEAFKKGLKLNKEINDESQDAFFYVNLATVYEQMNLYQESVNYSKQAYDIFKRDNSIRQLSTTVNVLSLASRHLNDYKSTARYLQEMKKIADELKENKYYVLYYQSNANFLNDIHKYSEALQEANRAIAFGDSIDDRAAHGTSFLVKADILVNMKDYSRAIQNYDRSINLIKDNSDKHNLAYAYKGKSNAYKLMGDFNSALLLYERADEILDSLNTNAYTTKIATLNAVNNLDKKEKELQLSIKEREMVETKNKQQSQFLNASITIGILILVLLAFSIRAYLVKKSDNKLLNSQKTEIELKNTTLHLQKIEIQNQMNLIEEKHKEITDSISYAERIQRSLLASESLLNAHLNDYFILFKPKDVVSGDFYWAACAEASAANGYRKQFILVTADSTGHGVPGAIMSILNISCLDKAVTKGIERPDLILNETRGLIINHLKNDGSVDGGKDGMDGSLLSFDFTNKLADGAGILHCASANNAVWIIRNKELIEIKADRMPIGKHEKDNEPFTLNTFYLKKGDVVYTSTDGFADQFGGAKGKKFKQKQLQELLLSISYLSMEEQKQKLNDIFDTWKGNLEQVDDVCLIGLRI
jgi:tetratricopeptide (TPR) repeat protein